ncbi:6460_t:CDS:2 [Funneliformis geosporum]|nr:6460_t:CDS:2 [Funneliformis geosporum]
MTSELLASPLEIYANDTDCISPIELIRKELALVSGECHMVFKKNDFRKKDPLSDDTIEDEDSLADNIANTQIQSSREISPRTNREQERFRGLLYELSTSIKGGTTETNNEDEGSGAYQEEIHCWYYYAERFEKSVKDVKDNDKRVKDQQARTQVYNAILKHLSNITRENLRKKTQRARNIFELFQ